MIQSTSSWNKLSFYWKIEKLNKLETNGCIHQFSTFTTFCSTFTTFFSAFTLCFSTSTIFTSIFSQNFGTCQSFCCILTFFYGASTYFCGTSKPLCGTSDLLCSAYAFLALFSHCNNAFTKNPKTESWMQLPSVILKLEFKHFSSPESFPALTRVWTWFLSNGFMKN